METTGMAKRILYRYLPMLVRVGAVRMSRRIVRAECGRRPAIRRYRLCLSRPPVPSGRTRPQTSF